MATWRPAGEPTLTCKGYERVTSRVEQNGTEICRRCGFKLLHILLPRSTKPPSKLHHGRNNAGYNQREGPWRVRRHRIDFRETHRDCCKPGQQNARTHPSLVYLTRQPVTAETVYQSCPADARVCKCSMDSYPETRPNPNRECSATSNEADTRATRQRL